MITFESLLPDIHAYFQDAQQKATAVKKKYVSLGGNILFSYASDRIEKSLFKAFEHLEVNGNGAQPEFRIFVCDAAILNCGLPGYEWMQRLSDGDEKLVTYNSGNIHVLYNPKSGIFSMVDTADNRGFYYLPRMEDIPFYEKAAPMRMLLHWWCEKSGYVFVHGAAIALMSNAVLLAGRSGTGKSTTALLAAQNGFGYLGDDYVILQKSERPVIQSAYNSVKFRWEMLDRIPAVQDLHVNQEDDDKGYFFLSEKKPDAVIRKAPLKAVLLPIIENKNKTVFHRVAQSRGLMGLAASSIFQMPGSGKQTLKNLADILKDVPVYQMTLGADNREIVDSLRQFLKDKNLEAER